MTAPTAARDVELILSDVDGVLTDGGIVFDNQGIETKRFHVRDGFAVKLWTQAGYRFGVLTGRVSHIVKLRAAELGIDPVRQGFQDKFPTAREVISELELKPEQVCYIGDDLTDLPVMRHVGWAVGVADAVDEIREYANLVTQAPGGRGAVREFIWRHP